MEKILFDYEASNLFRRKAFRLRLPVNVGALPVVIYVFLPDYKGVRESHHL